MVTVKPYSVSFLTLGGFLLIIMGIYFVFLRPSLLPEDLNYMKTNLSVINGSVPGLAAWLQKVFCVVGGFCVTSGLLTIFIALTAFRTRIQGAFAIILISGITSIGFMTLLNFIINSNFKWALLIFTLPWLIALILYRFHK